MKFTTVDEYISSFPKDVQKILENIRSTIKTIAPDAQEKISYQIAAFELNGRNLIHFAGWKKHISLYPIPAGDEAFDEEVSRYADGKGTIKFPLNKPIPMKLVRRVIKLHLEENLKKTKSK